MATSLDARILNDRLISSRRHVPLYDQALLRSLEHCLEFCDLNWAGLVIYEPQPLLLATAGRPDCADGWQEIAAARQCAAGAAPAELRALGEDFFVLPLDCPQVQPVLLVHSSTWSTRQQALLHALADALVAQLRHLQLSRQNQRLIDQFALINRLGQHSTTILDLPQLFSEITAVICQALGYDHTQLLLIDERRQVVELVHASGPAGQELLSQGFVEQVGGRGIIGWVAGSGQIWVGNDVSRDPHFAYHRLLAETQSEIALPLKIGERVIGVLDVQSEQREAFNAEAVFLLQTVADQIAPPIERGRLAAAANRERELALTLSDVSRIICSSLELDQVLDSILEQIGRVVPHRSARIGLLSEDGSTIQVGAARGYADNEAARRGVFRLDEAPIAASIVNGRQAMVLADVRSDPRWLRLPGIYQIRSWCGVPLIIKDRCIGTLSVDWDRPDFYTEDHAKILQAFADQVGVAIENARLYEATRSFSEQLEQKVQHRTSQLRQARDELETKAAELRALVHRVVEVQEAERKRIAGELHDSIIQSILAVNYELQALRRRIGHSSADADTWIDSCQRMLDGTLQEMKQIIHALRPRALDELGLLAALEHLMEATRATYGQQVSFATSGEVYALPARHELAIYRIVQEAIQNGVRHARAGMIHVQLSFAVEELLVCISDDGSGFEPQQGNYGLGLVSMRERAQEIGGELKLHSAIGQGTQICVRLQRPESKEQ